MNREAIHLEKYIRPLRDRIENELGILDRKKCPALIIIGAASTPVARTLTFACTSTSPGFAEEKDMAERSFDPNLERLRGLKAKYDPDDLFRGHLDVRPSTRVRIER
jgi:hypothetical protein